MRHLARSHIRLLIASLGVIALTTVAAAWGRGHRPEVTVESVPAWSPRVDAVNEALAKRDVRRALAVWREAHAAARAAQDWEGMLAVGDAYLRIGEAADFRRAFVPGARHQYLGALLRARDTRSVEGVLSAAEAFAGLGDVVVVRQALGIAEPLIGPEPNARVLQRLATLSRWAADRMVAAAQR
jgi:hypothetical protein